MAATLAWHPNAELWKNHLGLEDSALAGFAALGVKNNPKFPGITDPADLWLEFNMHSHKHLLALTAYCNVATMYGISPVGLNPSFKGISYATKGGKAHFMDGITD